MASGAIAIIVCTVVYGGIALFLLFMLQKFNPQEKA
jgi:hypothetical protein